jgi:hypothetical protein
MHGVRTFVVAALMATTGWTFTCGAERVDLLLILASDVSGSMDESKLDCNVRDTRQLSPTRA